MDEKIKSGDIFYSSWGYDQTNYDYVIVLSVSKTGKTCTCQRTGCANLGEDNSGQDIKQKPINKPFGDKFRMNIKTNDRIRGSYPFLYTGAGPKRLDTLWKVEDNRVFYETSPYCGH